MDKLNQIKSMIEDGEKVYLESGISRTRVIAIEDNQVVLRKPIFNNFFVLIEEKIFKVSYDLAKHQFVKPLRAGFIAI